MYKTGSVKDKIVAPDLAAERAKCDFDQEELRVHLMGGPVAYNAQKDVFDRLGNNPATKNHIKWYEYTPEEKQEDLWARNKAIMETYGKEFFKDADLLKYPFTTWSFYFQGLLPGFGLHTSMYWMSVLCLASEEQKARWMPDLKSVN